MLESREGRAVLAQRVAFLADGGRAQEVLRPLAQDPLGRGVHRDDGPVGVLVDHSLEHGVVQEPEAFFALAQRLRRPLALGDVVEDGGEARSLERDRDDPEVPLQGLEVDLERGRFAALGDLRVLGEVRGLTRPVGLAGAPALDRSRAHGGVALEGRIDVGDDVVDRLSPLVDEFVQSHAFGHAREEGAEPLLVLAQRLFGAPALRLGAVQRACVTDVDREAAVGEWIGRVDAPLGIARFHRDSDALATWRRELCADLIAHLGGDVVAQVGAE